MRQGFSEGVGDMFDWTRLIWVIGRKFGWLVILDMFSGVSHYLWLLIYLLPKNCCGEESWFYVWGVLVIFS